MSEWTASPLGTFLRDTRGVGAVEIALCTAMLISVAALSFDFYSRMKAATASARVAVGMADYVSRDTAPPRRQPGPLPRDDTYWRATSMLGRIANFAITHELSRLLVHRRGTTAFRNSSAVV